MAKMSRRRRKRIIETFLGPDGMCGCTFCGHRMHACNVTIDHDRALSRGGDGADHNLQPACARCNNRKGPRTGNEFRYWLSTPAGRKWLLNRPTEEAYRRRRAKAFITPRKSPGNPIPTWLPPERS